MAKYNRNKCLSPLLLLGGDNILARFLNLKVSDTISLGITDLNEALTGVVYTGSPEAMNNAPSDISSGPCTFLFLGLSSSTLRGVQVGFSTQHNGTFKLYMRGATFNGWTAWKSVSLT